MSGLKLHEIVAELDDVLELAYQQADENEGEIPEDLSDKLDKLQMQRDGKIANIARYIKNLGAEQKAVKVEADRLTARKRALDNKVAWLKDYLSAFMNPGEKFKDAVVSIYWNNRESVQILDPTVVPVEFQKEVEPQFDKKMIMSALKENESIPGVDLAPNTFIVIR